MSMLGVGMVAMIAWSGRRNGQDVDYQLVRQDDEVMEFNITGCRYADIFRALGEPGRDNALRGRLSHAQGEQRRRRTAMDADRYEGRRTATSDINQIQDKKARSQVGRQL
jgi:hypothetical protein